MSSREHQQYDEQLVIRYLLGSVPEAEAERLDELSVADEEFANRLAAVENDLVDAYVRGELAAETRDRFQSYYLSSSRRREKVNFAEALLAVPVPNAVPVSIPAPARGAAQIRFFSGFCRGGVPRVIGRLLFSCIKTFSFGIELVRSQQKTAVLERSELEARNQIERLAQAANGSTAGLAIVLSPQLRGAGPLTAIAIHPGSLQADFQLELEPGDFAEYRARLRIPAREPDHLAKRRIEAASRGEIRFVPLRLPAAVLKPRNYTLELSGITAIGSPELLSSYSFTVVP